MMDITTSPLPTISGCCKIHFAGSGRVQGSLSSMYAHEGRVVCVFVRVQGVPPSRLTVSLRKASL